MRGLMNENFVRLQLYRAVGIVEMEIAKVINDVFGFKPEAENEAFKAMPGVDFHDVPENRPLADRHHRFGTEFGFFLQARAQPPAEDEHGDLVWIRGICHESNSHRVKTTNEDESTRISR